MTKTQIAHPVVSQAEWLSARKELLAKEKSFSHQRDALSAERRKLPWVKVEKEYAFDAPAGEQSLADLFGGRSQLIVYHFMLGPGWEEGCPSCSFLADRFDGAPVHLAHRDVTPKRRSQKTAVSLARSITTTRRLNFRAMRLPARVSSIRMAAAACFKLIPATK